jgi:hypothetical protein
MKQIVCLLRRKGVLLMLETLLAVMCVTNAFAVSYWEHACDIPQEYGGGTSGIQLLTCPDNAFTDSWDTVCTCNSYTCWIFFTCHDCWIQNWHCQSYYMDQ